MKITMKKKTLSILLFASLSIFFVFGIFFGVLSYSYVAYGVNNTSVIVRVNVTNTEPNIYYITAQQALTAPGSPVELTAGGITTVNCTALVFDYNGWEDVNRTNASIFYNTSGGGITYNSADDNNTHLSNRTCSGCIQYAGGAENASCTCQFTTRYFANNGSWNCNMTVFDKYGMNDSNTSGFRINPLIALNTTTEVDYGNLVVTQISSMKEVNISNMGNVDINLTLRSYGGLVDTESNQNWTLVCAFNNISRSYHRWTINGTGTEFAGMTPIHNTTTDIGNLTLPQRTNDSAFGRDFNQTYFQLEIPLTVGGYCNGTLIFAAVIGET